MKKFVATALFHSLMAVGYAITATMLSPFLALWWIEQDRKDTA
jgi:hypothetical protein